VLFSVIVGDVHVCGPVAGNKEGVLGINQLETLSVAKVRLCSR
jgi:hypothetical protein